MNACVTMFIDTGKVLDTEALLIVLDTEVGVASRVNNIPILTRKVRSTAYGKQIIPTAKQTSKDLHLLWSQKVLSECFDDQLRHINSDIHTFMEMVTPKLSSK